MFSRTALAGPVLLLFTTLFFAGCTDTHSQRIHAVEQEVRSLLQLHTYEHVYRDIVYFGEEKSFLFVKTMDRRLLFSINIVVTAGIDLSTGLEIRSDSRNPGRVFVTLPQPVVLSVDADESSIHQYLLRERGGEISWLDYADQIAAIKQRVADDAVSRGILKRAGENARTIVAGLFTSAGFPDVQVAIRTSTQPSDTGGMEGGSR